MPRRCGVPGLNTGWGHGDGAGIIGTTAGVDAVTGLRAGQDELEELLALTEGIEDLGSRLARISAHLVGRPYRVEPLIGSPVEEEQLVSRLDGFDCVTFVESVIALAGCRDAEEYEPRLKALRYRDGQVKWSERNHYMSLWLDRNEATGAVGRVLRERWVTEETARILRCLEGFPAFERSLEYLPVGRVEELYRDARSGDLVCFVSTRDDLDTYHVGMLVRQGAPLPPLLRHASRSAGQVVEETLAEFLQRNETPGLLAARPLGPGDGECP
jgi:hypothetical protein